MNGNYEKFMCKSINTNKEFFEDLNMSYDDAYELSRLLFLNLFYATVLKKNLLTSKDLYVSYSNDYETFFITTFKNTIQKYSFSEEQKNKLFDFVAKNYMNTSTMTEDESETIIIKTANLNDISNERVFFKSNSFNRQIRYYREVLINSKSQIIKRNDDCPFCSVAYKMIQTNDSPRLIKDEVIKAKNGEVFTMLDGDFYVEEITCLNCGEQFTQERKI